jgi:hypothetical protein
MTRTLPPLVELAQRIADEVSGTARMLGGGEYPSCAIALGDRHPLLIRDHGWTLTLSLPVEHSWSLATPEDWQKVAADVKRLASGSHPVALSDAVLASSPVLARTTGATWDVSFPGTPVPREVWLRHEKRSVGMFQETDAVRFVIWVGTSMRSKTVNEPGKLATLGDWLESEVAEQKVALDAEEVEAKRIAALPIPAFEDVMTALKVGIRIRTGGGRYSRTYFLDEGVLRCDIFDEGDSYVENVSEKELRETIALYPEVFREALRR